MGKATRYRSLVWGNPYDFAERVQAPPREPSDLDLALIRSRLEAEADREPLPRPARTDWSNRRETEHQVVYYVRFGDRVKIGTSGNPALRLSQLPYDVLLGVERGGYDLERKRHQQFVHLHVTGEWFKADDELLQFASMLPAFASA